MKIVFSIAFSLFLIGQTFGQEEKEHKVTFNEHSFFEFNKPGNQKLIIFLHGGVNNPFFTESPESVSLSYLLEGNEHFIPQMDSNGFDLIAPITNPNFNWLKEPDAAFKIIWNYLDTKTKVYEEVYLIGFSDGGTGSYKIFYKYPSFFDGLIVFNGYPQHLNFYKTVNYSACTDKTIAFFGTTKDKTIAYEFLMTEYCKQKKFNSNTFLYLEGGKHSFNSYSEEAIKELFDILTGTTKNTSTEAVQGFVKNDSLITLYPFRKNITKEYNFGKETYQENVKQFQKYNK